MTDDSYERRHFSVTAVAEFHDLDSAGEYACARRVDSFRGYRWLSLNGSQCVATETAISRGAAAQTANPSTDVWDSGQALKCCISMS